MKKLALKIDVVLVQKNQSEKVYDQVEVDIIKSISYILSTYF